MAPASVDSCQVDCTSWLKYSLAAALKNQRRYLCGCYGDAASPPKTTAELRVLVSAEGITGVQVAKGAPEAAHARCLTRQAGRAVESWLRLRPGWFSRGGSWSQDRLAASWRKTDSTVRYDWEGLTCRPQEREADPGEPRLSAAWLKEYPDGLVCRVFHCAPSPGCCKPRNVVWQFPLVSAPR